jgi:uncharacterized CHY-type Zn-finger protein
MALLAIPTELEAKHLIDGFNRDMATYTVLDGSDVRPIICAVCDSIPTCPQWATTCNVKDLAALLEGCNMQRRLLGELYPPNLLNQYTAAGHPDLEPYVLSPATFVNEHDEVIICKNCLAELTSETKKAHVIRRKRPKLSIANGYVIGNAPVCLTDLSQTELSLISRTRTYCQSWVFFGGCHQHIKGWHTFFKNRSSENVGDLTMLSESGLKGLILVVLCGPFTATQKALILNKVAVDPLKVVAAWRWLKANNYRFRDDVIPNVDDIAIPKIVEENK